MLFNSLQFVVFFFIVTIAYFQLPHKVRWLMLLLASCYFYMAFVPKYILIIGATIVIDYFAAILMDPLEGHKRRLFLVLSLCANIGILVFFKYYNFFNSNVTTVFDLFHHHNPIPALSIILPIGLSFHTFQAMSYTIEVYWGNQKPERHFGIYALYVMFYPQMVAGPIERPQNMLHQFHEKHTFDWQRVKAGVIQMLFGFFKKVVIADRLAYVVDYSYKNVHNQNGLSALVAVVFYAFQIYCDFSGYSDIALGAAKVIGFDLMMNFNTPLISRNVTEFWRRWHISLSTWFNDYLFTPYVSSKRYWGKWAIVAGLFLTFGISGLWHGASWVFITWGLLHAAAMTFEFLTKKTRTRVSKKMNSFVYDMLSHAITFTFLVFVWIFFRAPTFPVAFAMIGNLFHISLHDHITSVLNHAELLFCIVLMVLLLIKEKYYLVIPLKNEFSFWAMSVGLIAVIYFFGVFDELQFIYFQF